MTKSDPEAGQGRPAVFFDRDGVVNRSPGDAWYVLNWDAFEFSAGIFEVLKLVKERGYLAIVVTSQKGVGKGMMTEKDLDEIHQRMQEKLRVEAGYEFDAIYSYTGTPDCRHQPKPHPEMILTAAQEHGIDLNRSWLIGDADRDIEMARSAGVEGAIRIISDKPVGIEANYSLSRIVELEPLLGGIL